MLFSDCPTPWNSTYDISVRTTELKEHLDQVLKAQNMDGIGNSEWPKLQMLVDLL